jgi:hypothetical protein
VAPLSLTYGPFAPGLEQLGYSVEVIGMKDDPKSAAHGGGDELAGVARGCLDLSLGPEETIEAGLRPSVGTLAQYDVRPREFPALHQAIQCSCRYAVSHRSLRSIDHVAAIR